MVISPVLLDSCELTSHMIRTIFWHGRWLAYSTTASQSEAMLESYRPIAAILTGNRVSNTTTCYLSILFRFISWDGSIILLLQHLCTYLNDVGKLIEWIRNRASIRGTLSCIELFYFVITNGVTNWNGDWKIICALHFSETQRVLTTLTSLCYKLSHPLIANT